MNYCVTSFAFFINFFLYLISNPSKALECYQCESNTELECSEKFDHDFTRLRPMPCNNTYEASYCIKATGMFEGEIGTKRFCSSRDFGDYCDYVRRPGDERHYRSCIYTCSGDACNQSWSVTHTTVGHALQSLTAMTSIAFTYLNLNRYYNY